MTLFGENREGRNFDCTNLEELIVTGPGGGERSREDRFIAGFKPARDDN